MPINIIASTALLIHLVISRPRLFRMRVAALSLRFCGFFLRLFRLPRQARLGLFDRSRSFFSALTGFLGAAVRNNRRNFASGFADRLCGGNECAVFRLLRFVLLFVCHSLILTAIQALRAIQNAVSPDEPRNARRPVLTPVRDCGLWGLPRKTGNLPSALLNYNGLHVKGATSDFHLLSSRR
jgi:hypothetical protein